jgi:hypothetical protein
VRHFLPSEKARVGALRGSPQGARLSVLAKASSGLGVTCRSRAGSRRVSGVTAEAGRIRDFREGGAFAEAKLLSSGSNAELVGVPLA